MTGSTSNRPLHGRGLMKLARLVFDEPELSTIVVPALADYQEEMREAGDDGLRRTGARMRGCVAFSRLVLSAPFISSSSPLGAPLTTMITGRYGGNVLLVLAIALLAAIVPIFGWFALVAVVSFGSMLAVALRAWNTRHPGARSAADALLLLLTSFALLAAIWSMFGWFVVATMIGGVVMAIALRRWNTRYPSALAPATRTPQAEINLSSIPVAGDIGGLLFVIGAIITVLLGLPDIRWFVLASVIVGGVLAGGLSVWRSSHTRNLAPPNSILLRR